MTPKRRKRLILVSMMMLGVIAAVTLVLTAFRQNIMNFHSPTDVAAGAIQPGQRFRVGGMVVDGSVNRPDPDSLDVSFRVSDTVEEVEIRYDRILPDLFSEGQGIVAIGTLSPEGYVQASEVLAKHDENYMPPEVAEALEKAGQMPGTAANFGSKTLVDP